MTPILISFAAFFLAAWLLASKTHNPNWAFAVILFWTFYWIVWRGAKEWRQITYGEREKEAPEE